ncbi:MAG: hypothetical protein IMW89_06255 [Ktedonobacteraceae bacterium]|nr:hypothetical protein [Ktedonobacteraceae bacterium]
MPDLDFEVAGAEIPAFAAVPMLLFKLRIVNKVGGSSRGIRPIQAIALRCQIQIAVTRRHYGPAVRPRLLDVFGESSRWSETLRDLLWTHASAVVPPFSESIVADLPVPSTYDFDVVATKYFDALEGGDIPLTLLFSGTIFYEGEAGNLQVAPIPWSKEAAYRLPVATWREMIARYYPDTAWIRLHKDVFDRLYQYKVKHGLPTWEEALTHLLQASGEEVRP